MPKKGLKYLLISLVLLIWGLIIYRIVQGMGHDEPLPAQVQQQAIWKPMPIQDTFSLRADYPDPFESQADSLVDGPREKSGANSNPSGTTGGLPSQAPGFQASTAPVFNPSDLKYTGFIGTINTKRKTAIITYKGTEYSVKETDRVDHMQIIKIDPAFMIVSFGSHRETVNLER